MLGYNDKIQTISKSQACQLSYDIPIFIAEPNKAQVFNHKNFYLKYFQPSLIKEARSYYQNKQKEWFQLSSIDYIRNALRFIEMEKATCKQIFPDSQAIYIETI